METKRILWMFNHKTLMKSEVAILREMGYEVYMPKIIPFDVSVGVDWESDKLLSIPQEAIDLLNTVDFYEKAIPSRAMDVLNEYFHIAMFELFIEPLKSLVCHFKGILVFHPFGLFDGLSYTQLIERTAGVWLLRKMEEVGTRFWFGQSYENLSEIECDFFQKRAIHLPIGMRNTDIEENWTGEKKKILFVCPRIKVSPYFEKLYLSFREEFKNIPYSIGGAQPIEVESDPDVLGYLPQKEYEELYPSHAAMFYHSTDKRHVHYHPFEAVKQGLPLVFMAGGLLDELGGSNLPGRCATLKEAKQKCKRLVRGDRRFAEKIRKSQGVLLEKMSYEYCLEKWSQSFEEIENRSILPREEAGNAKKKKIAFVLPLPYLGGVLDYSLRMIKAFVNGMRLKKEEETLEIVFAVPQDIADGHLDKIEEIEDYGVKIRGFRWEVVDRHRVEELSRLIGHPLSVYRDYYNLMNDGISYFEDVDFLLFMSNRAPENLFMLKPYGTIVHDYMQRYIPMELSLAAEVAFAELVRNSECCFTTSENAQTDCVQYMGVKKEKIHLIPLFFEDISAGRKGADKSKKYFVWSTNINPHKNHKTALKALSEYYAAGGKLRCYITGVNTKVFDCEEPLETFALPKEQIAYVSEIRQMIEADEELRENLRFMGNLEKKKYYSVVEHARFMMHPGMADNGNGAVVDAAFLWVPSISSDYAAMRNIDRQLQLGLVFFDKKDAKQLAEKLLWAQENYGQMKEKLPSPEELRTHTCDDEELSKKMYEIVTQQIYL